MKHWFRLNHFIGIYLITTAVASCTYYALKYPDEGGPAEMLWYCNVVLFVAAFGFILKKSLLITPIFITAISTQFFWVVGDILYMLGLNSFDRNIWLALDTTGIVMLIDFNYHFTVIPLTIYGMWKYGYDRRAFKASCVLLVIIAVATRLFTLHIDNIN